VALERIRTVVETYDWQGIAEGLRPTISAGVAAWQPGETMNQVLSRAEDMLRDAKAAGRNCVRAATEVLPES
jgi:PleD family two-component response regulator